MTSSLKAHNSQFSEHGVSRADTCALHLSFRKVWAEGIRVVSALGRFGLGRFGPILGVGRFGLGWWVDSALGRFGPGSFRPKSIPKCRLLRTGRQTSRKIDR